MLFFPPPNGNSPAKTKLNKTKQNKKTDLSHHFLYFCNEQNKNKTNNFPPFQTEKANPAESGPLRNPRASNRKGGFNDFPADGV